MSKTVPSTDNIDDIVLGLFGSVVPTSPQLDHAVRFFNTWSGNDKLMMITQYGVKLLAPLMQLRAEMQFRAGRREKPLSPATEGLSTFATQLSLARRVSGFWGILAVLKSLSALERARPTSRTQLNIQRLQGISMLVFYPLEYISFFSSQPAPLLRGLSPRASFKAGLWSIRAWGTYVVLQITLLLAEWKELAHGERMISDREVDVAAVRKRKRAIVYQLVASVSRLPVILHWSLIGGLYKNELWTNGLSFISAVADIRGGWEATRIPPPKH